MHQAEEVNTDDDDDVEEDFNDTDDSALKIEEIGTIEEGTRKLMTNLLLEASTGKKDNVKCQIDTGATCNVMSHRDLKKLTKEKKPKMLPTETKLKTYDGHIIPVKGKVHLKCEVNHVEHKIMFNVVKTKQAPLLSSQTSIELGLIKVCENVSKLEEVEVAEEMVEEFKDRFTGLGCLPGKYQMDVDTTVKPVQHAPRRVPVPLKAKLKEKIKDLEKRKIIAPVKKATPWISSMISVLKPDKIRVCLDPKDLNKAIRRPKYPMPNIDEVLPDLAKARVFTVLDAKDGFHQVELTEESSYLTCFWTPFGRYRYLRMPMGINSGPEEWQRRQDEIISDLPGVIAIADDILVYGCGDTPEEYMRDHNENLRRLFERAREVNLKFNRKKMKLCLQSVRYMGHLLTSEGLMSDPAKIEGILDMPRPEDKHQVQTLLGCVNYLSRYLPQLSAVAEPLRKLSEKNALFMWQSSQEEAFQEIKQLLVSAPVLKYYDVKDEVTVESDASDKGLGGTILQNGQPVGFTSRALTPTEQNYAQIEKEALAIVFTCERFDQYLHGRDLITVKTDHKPLIPIFKKPISQAPKRLQRMMLRLQKYNLDIQYQPGPQMYIADCLSRNYARKPTKDDSPSYQIFKTETIYEEIENINQLSYINIKDVTVEKLQKDTSEDPDLQQLKNAILNGWPEKHDTPASLKPYQSFQGEMTVQNGLIYRGMRVIVPKVMQAEMLKKIHASHQGIDASLRRAKDVIFWPGMTAQIKDMIAQCGACNTYQDHQSKEPMLSHETPTRAWSTISQDLFTLHGETYLITVDHYSDFWELDNITSDTTSTAVVKCTKNHLSRYGTVDKIITDNGPQFISSDYKEFTDTWQIQHITSSPHHSQANGKAESAVKIAKKLLKKVKHTGQDMHIAILEWRNTPNNTGSSPVQRLMSHRTKTLLPTAEELLKPRVVDNVDKDIDQRKKQAKKQYDKHTIPLPELAIGETVRLQPDFPHQQWRIAKCLQKVGPRSYLVQTEEGRKYRRNRKYLRTTKEDFKEQDSSIAEPEITAASNKQDFNASSKSQVAASRKSQVTASRKSQVTASSKSQVTASKSQVTASRKAEITATGQPDHYKTTDKTTPAPKAPDKPTALTEQPTIKTRSGRTVQQPAKLKDYVV